jgi:hypothetical protein
MHCFHLKFTFSPQITRLQLILCSAIGLGYHFFEIFRISFFDIHSDILISGSQNNDIR